MISYNERGGGGACIMNCVLHSEEFTNMNWVLNSFITSLVDRETV